MLNRTAVETQTPPGSAPRLFRGPFTRWVEDADAEIEALFEESPVDVAIVSVESVLLLDDRAEVELRLWCGSHCAVFLTYEAVPYDSGGNIVGTTGGIAVA